MFWCESLQDNNNNNQKAKDFTNIFLIYLILLLNVSFWLVYSKLLLPKKKQCFEPTTKTIDYYNVLNSHVTSFEDWLPPFSQKGIRNPDLVCKLTRFQHYIIWKFEKYEDLIQIQNVSILSLFLDKYKISHLN